MTRFVQSCLNHPDSFRFLREDRLLEQNEFKAVFKDGNRAGGKHLSLVYKPNGRGTPRLGLAVAKRFVKTAVKRNLIKRQVRESFRLNKSKIGGFDIVLLVRPSVAKADRREIRETIDRLWRKMKK